ncbi:MAG: serine/threonine protein kinase [Planctomycetota bacterium]|nr:MAG: serine/threonine protein kinase [Planctomycetota bacterium]
MELIEDTNKFRLVRKLAEGGMGAVYEAHQLGAEGFEKTVALKTILEEYTQNTEFVEMFIGEAKLVADLVHQYIVQIYQLGKIGAIYYIAMEFINGVDLGDLIDRHKAMEKRIPVELAVYIISRACRGLEYAHRKTDMDGNLLGVVHRDMSPGNIMVTYEGVVKVTDFGIAKAKNIMLDQEGEVLLGKVHYMSPEQARFENTDGRSDIFSLGVVFYELLTTEPLVQAESTIATLQQVADFHIPPIREKIPDIPDEVEAILSMALNKDREKRYQSMGDMAHDMEYFMYNKGLGPMQVDIEHFLKKIYPNSTGFAPTQEGKKKTVAF